LSLSWRDRIITKQPRFAEQLQFDTVSSSGIFARRRHPAAAARSDRRIRKRGAQPNLLELSRFRPVRAERLVGTMSNFVEGPSKTNPPSLMVSPRTYKIVGISGRKSLSAKFLKSQSNAPTDSAFGPPMIML